MKKLTVTEIPEGWAPNGDVYLMGHDADAQYYRIADSVFRHSKSGSRFFTTVYAWPQAVKTYGITEESAD